MYVLCILLTCQNLFLEFFEIGRAGRDGDPAVALYLSSTDDRNFHLQNIGGLQCSEERQFKLENLYKIATFFTQTND